MSPIQLIALSIISAGVAMAQANECALVVRLVWMDGRSPTDARVTLRGPDDQVVETRQSSLGKVEFCELPLGLHSITVGEGECGTTRVSNLRYRPGYSQTIRVITNSCIGDPQGGYPSACRVYLRIKSRAGGAVPEAALQFGDSPTGPSHVKADKYGRMIFGILERSTSKIRLTAPGFEPQALEFHCNQQLDTERELILEPNPKSP